MNIDLSKQEVNLINKLLKKHFFTVKSETALAKLFDLQNKLKQSSITTVGCPKGEQLNLPTRMDN